MMLDDVQGAGHEAQGSEDEQQHEPKDHETGGVESASWRRRAGLGHGPEVRRPAKREGQVTCHSGGLRDLPLGA